MKFIHFGCWNKGECTRDAIANDLSRVMSKLNTYIGTNPIDFIVVAGDNYYPTTDDKTIINQGYLESGFACLPSNVPKYILYGTNLNRGRVKIME